MRYRWLLRSAVVIQLGPTGRKIAPSGDGHQNNSQNRDTRLRAGMSSNQNVGGGISDDQR